MLICVVFEGNYTSHACLYVQKPRHLIHPGVLAHSALMALMRVLTTADV